jgi:hypothetical protein
MRSRRVKSLKVARLFVLTVLPVVAVALISETAWSQQPPQTPANSPAQRLSRINPAPRIKPIQPAEAPPVSVPTPAIDPSSALGEALGSCEKVAEPPGSFALPGLKGEVPLDRCYKGRDHLVCFFNALVSEAKNLTDSYARIVEAKYPELNSVENICKVKRDALASDITGADDFTKRFAALKSQYESSSRCAANVKQAFRDVVLADMAQPPDILKSMNDSIDADITKVSQAEGQIADLAEKMVAATKAMKTIEKIHRTMCVKDTSG